MKIFVQDSYRRLISIMLTLTVLLSHIGLNYSVALAADVDSSLFLLDIDDLVGSINDRDSQYKLDIDTLGLDADSKSVLELYNKLLDNTYVLDVDINNNYAKDNTGVQVIYKRDTNELILLYINSSDETVKFRTNISGYETGSTLVKAYEESVESEGLTVSFSKNEVTRVKSSIKVDEEKQEIGKTIEEETVAEQEKETEEEIKIEEKTKEQEIETEENTKGLEETNIDVEEETGESIEKIEEETESIKELETEDNISESKESIDETQNDVIESEINLYESKEDIKESDNDKATDSNASHNDTLIKIDDEQLLEDDEIEVIDKIKGKSYDLVRIYESSNARAYKIKLEDLIALDEIEYTQDTIEIDFIFNGETVDTQLDKEEYHIGDDVEFYADIDSSYMLDNIDSNHDIECIDDYRYKLYNVESDIKVYLDISKTEETIELVRQLDNAIFTIRIPSGAFNKEFDLSIKDVSSNLETEDLKDKSDGVINSSTRLMAYDISFVSKETGNEIEPLEEVNVNIELLDREAYDTKNEINILHIKDSDNVEVINSNILENTIDFNTDSFSVYVVAINTRELQNEVAQINDKVYKSLSEAIVDSTNGDTIVLLTDTNENVEIIGKDITLDLSNHKITSNVSNKPILYIKDGNVTIQNGELTGSNNANYGGAISIYFSKTGKTYNFTNLNIHNNTAKSGSGIYISGNNSGKNNRVNVSGCKISDNTCTNKSNYKDGGTISTSEMTYLDELNIKDCIISDNVTGSYGGAINARWYSRKNTGYAYVNIEGTLIENNIAYKGSGINLGNDSNHAVRANIKNSVIRNNKSTSSKSGSIDVVYGILNFESGAIYNNINTYGNKTTNIDITVAAVNTNSGISLMPGKDMIDTFDSEIDFKAKEYVWKIIDGSLTSIEEESVSNKKGIYTAISNNISIAEINGVKYKKLDVAIEKANETDIIELGSEGLEKEFSTGTIEINKPINMNFNDTVWSNSQNSGNLIINNNILNLSGKGKINGVINNLGELRINGDLNINNINHNGSLLEINSNISNSLNIKLGTDANGEIHSVKAGDNIGFESNSYLTFDISSIKSKISNEELSITLIKDCDGSIIDRILGNIKVNSIDDTIILIEKSGNNIIAKVVSNKGVWIDGKDGVSLPDGYDGTSDIGLDFPYGPGLKTFNDAKKVLEYHPELKFIHIIDEVTISGDEVWELDDTYTILRGNSWFTGNKKGLINIPSGSSLKLKGITIDGLGDTLVSEDSLIKVTGGTLELIGSEIKNNRNKNMSSQGGGLRAESGDVTIKDSKISNNISISGGGLYIQDGNVKIINSIISNNKAYIDKTNTNSVLRENIRSGGGIYQKGGNLELRESTINDNEAGLYKSQGGLGGGIYICKEAAISILDSKILDNEAIYEANNGQGFDVNDDGFVTNGTGGGLFVAGNMQDADISISGTDIEGNSADTGGGMYIDNGTTLKLKDIRITENKALSDNSKYKSYGGGIWLCMTGNAIFNDSNGGVLSNNSADKGEDFLSEARLDYEYKKIKVPEILPNGQKVTWYREDTKLDNISDTIQNWIELKEVEGELDFYKYPNLELKSSLNSSDIDSIDWDINIKNNTARSFGGGIACNGTLEVGEECEYTELEVEKTWNDTLNHTNDKVKVEVLNKTLNNTIIDSVILSEENGWKQKVEKLPNIYEYGVREVLDGDYIVEYEVGKVGNDSTKINIVNTPITSISVKKIWEDSNNKNKKRPNTIKVDLLKNGDRLEEIELSEGNNWEYTWNSLRVFENKVKIVYEVKEVTKVDGYETTYKEDGDIVSIINTLVEEETKPSKPSEPSEEEKPTEPEEKPTEPPDETTPDESTPEETKPDTPPTPNGGGNGGGGGDTPSDTSPVVDIPDNITPLSNTPVKDMYETFEMLVKSSVARVNAPINEIDDNETPLIRVPGTGDRTNRALWSLLLLSSFSGLAVLLSKAKKKEK